MSDTSQGPGWWQASDGRWYPPTATPGTGAPASGPPTSAPPTSVPPGYGPPGYGPPPYGPPAYGTAFGYGYGPPNPYGTATGLPSVSGLATASMVLGILSVLICCWPLMVCSLAGLPLGLAALTRIQKGAADPKGKGQAIAGVVLSSIALVLGILFLVLTYVGRST